LWQGFVSNTYTILIARSLVHISTDKPGVLESILKAGVNVVRINFSHGSVEEHLGRVKAVRNWAHDNNTYVGILMDLQGPKIRVAGFKDEKKIERHQ
jgi:pyruvate kinase